MDKRIPYAVLFLIVVQFGAGIWWAADLTSRVTSVEQKQTEYQTLNARIQGVEIKLEGMGTDLRWIRQALESERRRFPE